MANLADLKRSISELPYQEAFSLIKELRALRRMPKPQPVRKPSAPKEPVVKKKKQVQLSIEDMLKGMSKEEAAKLFLQLSQKG